MRLLAQNFQCATGSKYSNQLSHSLFFWRKYLVHYEQDSKTNTVDTKEDAVMIIYSRSTFKKKAKTWCEEDIPDSNKDPDSLQKEEEENSPNNLTTAKSTANLLFLKTATTPNTGTTSKKKKKRRIKGIGLNSSKEARERETQPCTSTISSWRDKITMATSRNSCNATQNKMDEKSNQMGCEHDLPKQRLAMLTCYSALKKTTTGKENQIKTHSKETQT